MRVGFALFFYILSGSVFAHEGDIPEFFYQSEEGQTTVQGELNFGINNIEVGSNELESDAMQVKGWVNYGITESFAVQFAVPFSFSVNNEQNGTTTADGENGLNNFEVFLQVHRDIGSLVLYYGVEAALTLDKTGSGPNFFSTAHSFDPYLGISRGEHCKYGAKFTYKSITSSGANVLGDFDYDLELFGEWDKEDKYLLGAALGYLQDSGNDDSLAFNFYGRVYFEKFTLIPRITYTHNLNSDIDSQLNLIATLGVRATL